MPLPASTQWEVIHSAAEVVRPAHEELIREAAQGGRDGPRLAATALNAQALIRYVRRPFGAMPAFTEKILSDQELTDIYAYLKSLPAAKAAKDIPLLDQIK